MGSSEVEKTTRASKVVLYLRGRESTTRRRGGKKRGVVARGARNNVCESHIKVSILEIAY